MTQQGLFLAEDLSSNKRISEPISHLIESKQAKMTASPICTHNLQWWNKVDCKMLQHRALAHNDSIWDQTVIGTKSEWVASITRSLIFKYFMNHRINSFLMYLARILEETFEWKVKNDQKTEKVIGVIFRQFRSSCVCRHKDFKIYIRTTKYKY